MKKLIIFVFLLFISVSLIACDNQDKKELVFFFESFEEKDIMNFIETDEGRYSVFLSNNSPWLYYTFSNDERHVIVAREERSFAYLMDNDDFSEIKDRKEVYYFEKNTKVLYFKDSNGPKVIGELESDNLNLVLEKVRLDLNHSGDISSFDSLYNVIKQFYSNIEASDLELMGKKDFKISTNYSSQDFLDKNKEFLNHLSFMYETSDKNKIVDSIDNNVYGAVDVVLHYNSNVKKINPILEVKKNQLQFYAIDPLDEDYNI